jgi:hypothetical protein
VRRPSPLCARQTAEVIAVRTYDLCHRGLAPSRRIGSSAGRASITHASSMTNVWVACRPFVWLPGVLVTSGLAGAHLALSQTSGLAGAHLALSQTSGLAGAHLALSQTSAEPGGLRLRHGPLDFF